MITLVVVIDSYILLEIKFLFPFQLYHSYLLHMYDIVTDFIILRAHHDLWIWYLLTWFILHSLGMITYSLPSLYMLQDLRSIIAGRRLLSCSMDVTIEGRS